ncbi:mitochondrial proton/calcium exchanger protein-like protein isoform X1 [Tanacetum coccineum]
MEEINNFQQEPDENLYQAWKRFKDLLMKCPQYYLTKMQEVVLFYNGLDVPTRQILDSRGAIPSKTAADAKVAIQEMVEYSQGWHNGTSRTRRGGYRETTLGFYQRNNASPSYQERRKSMEETLSKFMGESAKRHEENSNLIKEIRASTDAAIRNQGASIKTLEIQIGKMSKVLQERGFGSLPSSTETNPRDHVKSILTTVEADASSIRRIGSYQYAVSTEQNSVLMYETRQMTIPFLSRLNDCYCEDKKGSYGPQILEAYSYGASHIDKSIPRKEKDPGSFTLSCYINNVCFNNALADLGASVSVMPLSTYLNLGLGELAHTKLTVELADRTVKYPKGIAKNVLVEARLMGETLVLNRSLDPFFEDYIELNDLNVSLEIRRYQVDDLMPTIKVGEVIEEFRARSDARMVSKIFGYPSDCDHDKKISIDCTHNMKFSCMLVLEDIDAYRDEGMGDVIFHEPFLREVGINARRFEGMITIYNGNEEVTYQMVSEEDKMNGISHSYQNLKSFTRGS